MLNQKIKKLFLVVLLLLLPIISVEIAYACYCIDEEVVEDEFITGARTGGVFIIKNGSSIRTARNSGYDWVVNGINKFLNFNTTAGVNGYGFRDNSGNMEFKDSGGAWTDFATGGGGTTTVENLLLPEGNTIVGDPSGQGQATTSIFIAQNGNVGIGTESPMSLLDLKCTGEACSMIIDRTDGKVMAPLSGLNSTIIQFDNTGIFSLSSNDPATIRAGSSANIAPRLTITGSSGNVGIGDETPDANLEVSANGVTGASTSVFMLSSNDANDGDLFIVKNNGFVGIGTDSPSSMLHVSSETVNQTRGIISSQHITGPNAALIQFKRSRGSQESPITISNGDILGAFFQQAYTNSYNQHAGFGFVANGAISSGNVPTDIVFSSKITNMTSLTDGEAMRIKSTGLIGIGDTSPDSQLEVSVSGGADDLFMLSSDDANDGDLFIVKNNGNTGIGTTSPLQTLTIQGTNGTDILNIASSTGESAMYINEAGYLGIMNNNPTSKIHALDGTVAEFKFNSGTAALTPTLAVGNTDASGKFAALIAGTGGAVFEFDASGFFGIASNAKANYTNNTLGNGNMLLTILNTGNVGIGDPFPDSQLEISVSGGATDPFMLSSDDSLDGDLFIVKNSGFVGIGTTSPFTNLTVNGGIMGTGALYDNEFSPGASDFVLTSTGSGYVWKNISQLAVTGLFDLYYSTSTPSDITPYGTALTSPSVTAEQTVTRTSIANTYVPLVQFITATGTPGIEIIPSGAWHHVDFASIDSDAGTTFLIIEAWERDADGTETMLHQATSTELTGSSPAEYETDVVRASHILETDDRILMKFFIYSSQSGRNVTYFMEGTTNNSHVHTPIGVTHNGLLGLQGGSQLLSERYHFTLSEHGELTGWLDNVTLASNGDTTLPSLTVTGTTNLATTGGNVGIGTTTPQRRLVVVGDIEATGDIFSSSSSIYLGANKLSAVDGVLKLNDVAVGGGGGLWTEDGSYIYYSAGMVGIGTTTPTEMLSVQGNVNITGTTTMNNLVVTGIADLSTIIMGPIGLSTGHIFVGDSENLSIATSSLFIDSNGNIGIGTTTPQFELTVDGDIMLTGALYDNNYSAGNADEVLTSDGAGGVTWEVGGGGGGGGDVGGLYGINIETLSGDKTLTVDVDEIYQYLDTGASNRTVTLDTASASAGDRFIIRHNGAFNDSKYLQVKQGATELDKIYAGAIKEFIFDGTNWISGENGTGENDSKKYNVSIGYGAKGFMYAVAIGYGADSYNNGVAIGWNAKGLGQGAAVGVDSDGSNSGAAIGYGADGGFNGVALGRSTNTNSKSYSVALGYSSETERYSEIAHCIDGSTTQDYNMSSAGWAIQTADATPIEAFLGEISNQRFTLNPESSMTFTILATARDNTADHTAAYKFEGLIKRDGAGNTTLVYSSKTVMHEEDVSWDIVITADDTNDALKIEVTGDASNATRWAIRIDEVETQF